MKTLIRGQRSRLDALTNSLDLQIGIAIDAPSNLVFDFCCFGVDSANHLQDDRYFVFYNQRNAPNDAIVMRGANSGEHETFALQLARLPQNVRRLVFTATIDGGGTMSQIRRGHWRLSDASGEIARYEFGGSDFSSEQALLVGEIYWKDDWRVAAIGQGFAGDLSRLLQHFGGIEIEDRAAQSTAGAAQSTAGQSSAPQSSAGSMPPPPQSAPIVASAAANVPAAPSFPVGGQLQKLIDDTAEGGTLSLLRDEYEGPITISRAITIDGRGSVIWARQGPVLRVHSANVSLRDLDIEVTIPEDNASNGDGDVALSAQIAPQLQNVGVRGRVTGIGDDVERWNLPAALDLGEFAPRQINQWHFEIEAPTACELSSSISGLSLQPTQLSAGRQRVQVEVRDVARETLLVGKIEVRQGQIVRLIAISGRAARRDDALAVQGKSLWQPEK